MGSLPVHIDQECFYFETRISTMSEKKMTMVGFTSRQTAKQKEAQPQNPLGVDQASYGLRADGLLFKKGVKSSDAEGSRF